MGLNDQELSFRIRVDGSEEGKGKLAEVRREVSGLGPAGEASAGGVGRLSSGLATAAGAAAGLTAALRLGKQVLDAYAASAASASKAAAALAPAEVGLVSQYGPGATMQAAGQGVTYGVGAREAVAARATLTRMLGAGAGTEAAVTNAYRMGAIGLNTETAASAMGGLMAGQGLSANQASNLFYLQQTRTSGEGAEFLPRILGGARMLGFGSSEALALNEMVVNQGGTAETTMQLMRGLSGGSDASRRVLRRLGLEGQGLGGRLQGVLSGMGRMTAQERMQIFGETGMQVAGGLASQAGRFGEAEAAYSGALAPGAGVIGHVMSPQARADWSERRFQAAKTLFELGRMPANADEDFMTWYNRAGKGELGPDLIYTREFYNDLRAGKDTPGAVRADLREGAREGAREAAREAEAVHNGM